MKSWDNEKNEDYWSKSGPSFNLDSDQRKYNFEDLNKYSLRSSKQVPNAKSLNQKNTQSPETLSFSIKADSDLQCPETLCHACNKIIDDSKACFYEGSKVFTDEMCWHHWMDKMTEHGQINIDELFSMASKKYCLDRVISTCNGQLILKVILALKDSMQPFEFGSLLYGNQMACDHYVSFLKETHQNDDKFLRCNYPVEESISTLRELFSDNANVSAASLNQFIMQLTEFRDERLLNLNMPMQCEMIKEYVLLLDWQLENNKDFINAPLIETLISNNVSYEAITDLAKAKYLKDTFKLTPEEFVWTSLKSIASENKVKDLDIVFNHKVMNKPDIQIQRIVDYLVFLNKTPDEIKMRCLSKISDLTDLVECANMWKLLPDYMEYCRRNKDNSQLKKIQQLTNSLKK